MNRTYYKLLVAGCALVGVSGGTALADDVCNVLIQKSQTSNKRTVYLSDGNAIDLLQRYLQEAEKNAVKLDPWQLKVVYVSNKTKKEHVLNWSNRLTGQGAKEKWAGRLQKEKADLDDAGLKDAARQQWDIVCYSQASETKPAKPQVPKPPAPQAGPEKAPLEAKQYFQQGMQYAARKDYQNAITEFSNAITAYPAYAAAYSNRGVATMQLKKYDLAEDDLKKAVQLDPKDPRNHYNLACWYSLTNQPGKGLNSLDAALEAGFKDYNALRRDSDLANLRKLKSDWQSTLEKHKVFLSK